MISNGDTLPVIIAPNMLLLGGASRNVGKTEFACELIRRISPTRPVIAVKLTTVRDGGSCPHGEHGCGVCGSLKDHYCITEETSDAPGKDTTRMKSAGAANVFWLRVQRNHMRDGIADLLERIPPRSCVVCESNSLRTQLEPGAFLVIRDACGTSIKESCAAVLPHADRILTFDGHAWDMPLDRCRFEDSRWTVQVPATAAILAGGKSSRMGRDKALLPVNGLTLLEHITRQVQPLVEETLIGANDTDKYAFTGLKVVPDEQLAQGPLMGILSCLQAAKHDRVFVTACDIPQMPISFLQTMLRLAVTADVVMPRDAQGKYEPLLAVYTRRIIPAVRSILARGGRRIVEILKEPALRTEFVQFPEGDWYRNLNTPDDYAQAANL